MLSFPHFPVGKLDICSLLPYTQKKRSEMMQKNDVILIKKKKKKSSNEG